MNHADLLNRYEVAEVVARLGMAVDQSDWEAARGCFADALETDYTSLTGGEPARLPADALVAGWKQVLTPLDAVQHLLGPAVVDLDGDTAACRCAGQVSHVFAGERWVIGGVYRYGLAKVEGRWRIVSAAFDLQWQEGDGGLIARAGAGG